MSNWQLDASHSEVQFKVKHMVISTVTGKFSSFSADVKSDAPDFSDAVISFAVDINSIDTGNEQRDGHLKSDDFFNAEAFPQMKFTGKSLSGGKLTGDLTIRDVTKEVTLDADFGGVITDPWGATRAGFEVNGKLNRQDFGLKWSAVTEAGGLVVSDEVRIHVNVEFVKQA